MDTVKQMLASNRYLHLGTCHDNIPSVSLMNYTYVDGLVVFATPADTVKLSNIRANPHVSLLVHDLMSETDSSLSNYLRRLNTTSLNPQSSATIAGLAKIASGDAAETYRKKCLQANPDAECFIAKAEIVLVQLKSGRVCDSENNVETFEFVG